MTDQRQADTPDKAGGPADLCSTAGSTRKAGSKPVLVRLPPYRNPAGHCPAAGCGHPRGLCSSRALTRELVVVQGQGGQL